VFALASLTDGELFRSARSRTGLSFGAFLNVNTRDTPGAASADEVSKEAIRPFAIVL
jgi:hypothetical protein